MPEIAEIAFVLPADGEIPSDDRMLVRQKYGRVVIVTVPADAVDDIVGDMSAELTMARRRDEITEQALGALDDSERLALEGFWLRQSAEYQRLKEERPGQGISWDHPDFTPPDPPGGVDLEAGRVAGLNDRLCGSAAVGLVIVSGPGDLAFSLAQRAMVMAEVQSGLNWLGAQFQLTHATWVIAPSVVAITTPANPNAPDLEALWRDPAMAKLGYPSGEGGVTAYAQALQAANSTDSAYVSFFTHYPLFHFGYAKPWVPQTVMQYANDGWGPSNIGIVFAHETGHIFGAPDEYAASNCSCGGAWGYYHIPNHNCVPCSDGVPCIMNANTETMCTWTPRHIGAPKWRVGGKHTASPPFVVDPVIYFQGTNNKLFRIDNDGSHFEWLHDDNYTASTPFVDGSFIYYRGTNNKLYRVGTDGSGGKWLGDNYLKSSPFVTGGYIYYRGTNDKLYRTDLDGGNGKWIGDSHLKSTPFVAGGFVYYQGMNDKLYRTPADGSGGKPPPLGDNNIKSTPYIAGGFVYYQGTDDLLYKTPADGSGGKPPPLGRDPNPITSSPFVTSDFIYFRGKFQELYRTDLNGDHKEWPGTNYTKSTPIVVDKVIYFQGTDDSLWMINLP